jgi:hypothetical protein
MSTLISSPARSASSAPVTPSTPTVLVISGATATGSRATHVGRGQSGAFSEFTARLSPHLEVIQPHGDRGDANLLLTNLRAEHDKGTRRRPVNVIVGGDIVIWETELIASSNNPTGAPSAAAWVMSLDPNGLVRQMRLYELPQRSEAPLP